MKSKIAVFGLLTFIFVIFFVFAVDYYKVEPGSEFVTLQGECKKVTNSNDYSIFVPGKSSDEWTAFKAYASSDGNGLSIGACCSVGDTRENCVNGDVYVSTCSSDGWGSYVFDTNCGSDGCYDSGTDAWCKECTNPGSSSSICSEYTGYQGLDCQCSSNYKLVCQDNGVSCEPDPCDSLNCECGCTNGACNTCESDPPSCLCGIADDGSCIPPSAGGQCLTPN